MRSHISYTAFASALLAVTLLTAGNASAANADRHVRIINETSHTITRFYASNISVDSWQEDILGDDVLSGVAVAEPAPGEAVDPVDVRPVQLGERVGVGARPVDERTLVDRPVHGQQCCADVKPSGTAGR